VKRSATSFIELLAPAKNREQGEAAICHGADAVYIGGCRFGAREAAGNSFDDIEHLCRYAHRYFAKVYLTLNTILYDHELEQAREMVCRAYEIGCDAVIIQDMSLLEMDLPPIPLFASTQMDNTSVEKVKFLQDVGFRRVILARELSLQQIAEISSATTVELEAFVHGSLCVSYSGRCYLSEALANRSANRGACAQLCRLPFDLYNDKGVKIVENKHLLSMKDLNMSDFLEALIDAGITSFKIEGRLKDLSYAKNVTAYYRKRIDAILDKSTVYRSASSGTVTLAFEPDIERSFSRGCTTYFASARQPGLNSLTPKSTGKYCGTVISVASRSFAIDNPDSLVNGDGICFFDATGKLFGTRVNSVNGNNVTPLSMENISTGTQIFRNSDRIFDRTLSRTSAVRRIHVSVTIIFTNDSLTIDADDEDGISVRMHVEHCAEKSVDKDRMKKTVIGQLSKTGNEIYEFEIRCDECEYFFPISVINGWRRRLVSLLDEARQTEYHRKESKIIVSAIPYITDTIDYTGNVSNVLAERFYRRHGVRHIELSVETGTVPRRLMYNKYCIKFELGMCPKKQGASATGDLFLTFSDKRLKLNFDCAKCTMYIVGGHVT
jgi:putative protease